MQTLWKALGFFSWPVTALASINIGLNALGVHLADWSIVSNFPAFFYTWLPYIVGVAGILSVVSFVLMMTGCFSEDDCNWNK
jgi:hypothetical protein